MIINYSKQLRKKILPINQTKKEIKNKKDNLLAENMGKPEKIPGILRLDQNTNVRNRGFIALIQR